MHMLVKSDNHVFLGAFCSGHPVILEFLQHERLRKKVVFFSLPRDKLKASHGLWQWIGEFGEPLVPGINWCSVLMSLAEKQAPLKT